MIDLDMPVTATEWETVATLMVAKHAGMKVRGGILCQRELSLAAGLCDVACVNTRVVNYLEYSEAYRAVDQSKLPYIEVLAALSGSMLPTMGPIRGPLEFPDYVASSDGPVVLCPKAPKPEVELQEKLWVTIARFLRSYGKPVYLLGNSGDRFDHGMFAENENASEEPAGRKLELLASASLIVGPPNEYLWLATAWEKKMIVMYPDNIPDRRWFWFDHPHYARLYFDRERLLSAAVLAGMRQLIERL